MKKAKKDKKAKKPAIKKWVLRAQIISALKKIFVRSPMFQQIKNAHRRERTVYNKDGSESKAKRWEYQCAHCGEWFPEKIKGEAQLNIDHTEPVIQVGVGFVNFDTWIEREFVGVSYWDEEKGFDVPFNGRLSLLCLACHHIKSEQENAGRREVKKQKKEKK